VSYTLRGRIESRLAALLPLLAAACVLALALHRWWPVEAAALMLGVGLALDAQAYHRLLPYQPGWVAVPLGALELALLVLLMRWAGIAAPVEPAVALFVAGWLLAQLLGHAGFPLLRLGYAEDGGELGRLGAAAAVGVGVLLAAAGGTAYALRPPVVHLSAGVHRGPLVIARREVLVGDPGAIVRGGIVVRADGVTIKNVSVVGGDYGVVVDGYDGTKLDRVSVSGAKLDGIHVRFATVMIKDCSVDMLGNAYGQGIDISYTMDHGMNMIEGCNLVGGMEGIATHSSMSDIAHNTITHTTLRGIAMTEMSMGTITQNEVRNVTGVGIVCNDHSMCEVERNTVVGTRPSPVSRGVGFLASYLSEADLKHNELGANPVPVAVLSNSILRRPGRS